MGKLVSSSRDHLLEPAVVSARVPLTLDTSQVRDIERVDYWREMVLRLFADVEISAPATPGFHGQMQSRRSDLMRITRVFAAPQAVQRLHLEARENYEDCYFVVLMLSGTQRMQQDGRAVELHAGDFAIYDGARPHRLDFTEEWSELALNIPRPVLNRIAPQTRHLTAQNLLPDSGMGQVLRAFLRSVTVALPKLHDNELDALSVQALNLIGATLSSGLHPDDPSPSGAESALMRAKLLIDAHLGDPYLDASRIARQLGFSVRYLNRLFNSQNTSLMRYVWNQRLERARDDLLISNAREHLVLSVAMKWGFNDASHFSRSFKERFGMSPRECRPK